LKIERNISKYREKGLLISKNKSFNYRYLKITPPNSFIHVDDFESPKDLANYLHYLDGNDTAYREYLSYKFEYDRVCEPPSTLCEVCQRLHQVHGM
jgi:hypothetical protein